MTKPTEQLSAGLAQMALLIAQSILNAASGGMTAWDDLDEEQQADFLLGAQAASAAHDAWLAANGYKVIPPGTVQVPGSDDEAKAMVRAIEEYRQTKTRKKSLYITPSRLVTVPGLH